MLDAAVQRQLTQEHSAGDVSRDLAGARQDANGDREVVGRAGLLQIGGRQVHRDAAHGKLETRVSNRGSHPLLGLLNGSVRQTHDVERGQAGRDIHLRLNHGAVQADHGASKGLGKHKESPFRAMGATIIRGCRPAVKRDPDSTPHTLRHRPSAQKREGRG